MLFTCHAVAKSCPTLSDTITMDENLEYIFQLLDQDHLSTIPMEDFVYKTMKREYIYDIKMHPNAIKLQAK